MTSPAAGASTAADLPDYAPSIGGNLRRAVDEIAAANGVSNTVTHLVYSHHHADHGGASSLFDGDVVRVGHEETRQLLLRDGDPARPVPPAIALSYPWTHFICGHLGRLATRDDVAVHQAYIADIEASAKEALATVNPVPFYVAAGENAWAGSKPTSTPSPNAPRRPSSPSTPACWPPPTSRCSPPPLRSRSCIRCASTAGPADRFTPDQNAPGPVPAPVRVWAEWL